VGDIADFRMFTADHGQSAILLSVRRGADMREISVMPEQLQETGRIGIGVSLIKTGFVSYPWYIAPVHGLNATVSFTREILLAFSGVIKDVFMGRGAGVELSGPVGIAVVTGEAAKMGFRYLLQFAALLSVNLAIINILPFPALDGGRLLFIIIEAVRGKAINRKFEAVAHTIGFAFLMLLVLFVTYRDVARFGGGITKAIFGD
jgi:regulator of sigma E protease